MCLNKTTFSVQELVIHLMQTFETSFSQKCITPVISCEDSTLTADRDKLSQVIINLVSNALKFTPVGGTVTVEVQETERGTLLKVSDSGLGIAPRDLPHIFERFYRADVSRNRGTGGAGIGLTLVKAIVEAHKGMIEAASEVNKGTVFTIILPRLV